jgi:hypothetical protein
MKLKNGIMDIIFYKIHLYNPFDILLYLKNKEFRNYWYETGKTEFLFKLLKTKLSATIFK